MRQVNNSQFCKGQLYMIYMCTMYIRWRNVNSQLVYCHRLFDFACGWAWSLFRFQTIVKSARNAGFELTIAEAMPLGGRKGLVSCLYVSCSSA